MLRATELAHLLMRQSLKPGDWVVDATVGNGHDTLLLAELVGSSGCVIGFDVQEVALAAATERVDGLPQVKLIHAGHENLAEHLPVDRHRDLQR
jgi:ubiquinone/menaquinone biosynthesis C-methylase UbiE